MDIPVVETIRSFVAITLNEKVIAQITAIIANLHDDFAPTQIRWQPPVNLHITLRFLGNIEKDIVPRLSQQIQNVLQGQTAFRIMLDNLHIFPTHRPKVIALRVQPIAGLIALAHKIETATTACGFKPEIRPFLPHVTLGKINTLKPVVDLSRYDFPEISQHIDKITLYQSHLHAKGSTYSVLQEFVL